MTIPVAERRDWSQDGRTGTWISQRRWLPIFLAIACLSLGALASVFLGQDANWDLRNYHLYNGYAALHGRFPADLAPANLQSWINPTLDIPYAWLALGPLFKHPMLLAGFMGIWYGALIAAVLGIANLLYRRWPTGKRVLATIAATVIASTGAAVLSQAGTTFNEIQTGALVLAAVWLLARELELETGTLPRATVVVFAGALLGAAAGLKFTSGIFAIAAGLALPASISLRRWLATASLLGAGGVAGFATGGG